MPSQSTISSQKVVLIMGAGGFVGFHISRAFSQAGYKVYGLIRSETSADRLRGEEILPVIGSVESEEWLSSVAHEQFDVVITVTEDFMDPDAHTKHLMNRIISLANKNNGKRLHAIYTAGIKDFGSSGLAGEADFHIITEESPRGSAFPLNHRTRMLEELFANEKLDATVITPSMIYGKSHSWYAEWFRQAISSDTISFVGPSNGVWHGVHVEDVAQAFITVVENAGPSVFKQNFLVAGDNYDTVGDIVAALDKATGGNHKIETIAPTPTLGHMLATCSQWISNKKIKSIGWIPRKPSLTSGMDQYVASFRAGLKDPFYKPQPTWDQINALVAALMASKAQ